MLAPAVGLAQKRPPPGRMAQVDGAEIAPAAECCLVLLLPVGARAVSLGGALAARPSLDAVFANPAGLAGLAGNHFVVHHATGVPEQANAFSVLFTPSRLGTFGLSYQLFDYGEIEMTDEQGMRTGMLSLRDHLFVASYATHLVGGITAGVNYKVYHSRIGCQGACGGQQVTATTHAVDIGMQYHPSWFPSLRVGAAVTNAGFALQVINAEQADPLPTRARVGIALDVLRHIRPDTTVSLWLAVELEDRWASPGDPVASVGAELSAADVIFLRAGYVPGEGIESGVAVGVGLRYTRFTIGVAKSFVRTPLDSEQEPLQVSFGLRF